MVLYSSIPFFFSRPHHTTPEVTKIICLYMYTCTYSYICKPKFISVLLSWFKMPTWVDQGCFLYIGRSQFEQKYVFNHSQHDYISQHGTFKQLEATGTTTIHILISFNYCDEWQGINYTTQQNDTESTYKKKEHFSIFFNVRM